MVIVRNYRKTVDIFFGEFLEHGNQVVGRRGDEPYYMDNRSRELGQQMMLFCIQVAACIISSLVKLFGIPS